MKKINIRTRQSQLSPIQKAMLRNVAFIMFLCIFSWLYSITWEIKQDGTGDFTTIQAGIDASADADTVLAYPGKYYENLDFNGKNIILCSLELITGNASYIDSTIIDGQREESCIRIHNGETDAHVRGFTIQNGYGTQFWGRNGGGFLVHDYSAMFIINCIIKNNLSTGGAGLYARNGYFHLSGTIIKKNSGTLGGAIYLIDNSSVVFDQNNRCSIFNNNAGRGADLYIEETGHVNVIVDTFSVYNPSRYFAEFDEDSSYSFDIQNNWMELVPHDLYVAQNGDDNNSGLTPQDPLRNISWAVRKIQADEQNPRTIHVAAGVYSHEINQQIYPIGGKEFVSVIGENMNNTLLYDDYIGGPIGGKNVFGTIKFSNFSLKVSDDIEAYTLLNFYKVDKIILHNLKIQNNTTSKLIIVNGHDYIEYENIIIENNTTIYHNSGMALNNNSGYMKNCIISNNQNSSYSPEVAMQLMAYDDFTIENCIFSGNHSSSSEGRIIRTARHNGSGPPTTPTIRFNNCLITDNSIGSNYVCQNFNYDGLTEFNNCTITNNTASGGFYSSALYNYGDVNLTNTIMRNNTDYEVMMVDDTQFGYVYELNVDHCNIKNGEAGIYNMNNVNTINWGDGNIDLDPQFLQTGDHPYQLSELSPCIDAGTPDTTGLYLPPWDLLHHHRIWDGDGNGSAIIDMGCYEFGADSVGVTNEVIPIMEAYLSNFPNPFNPSTTIQFSTNNEQGKQIELAIYNVKGQKVKTLINSYMTLNSGEIIWEGKDDAGKTVSSGIYFLVMKEDGQIAAKRKMMLLK